MGSTLERFIRHLAFAAAGTLLVIAPACSRGSTGIAETRASKVDLTRAALRLQEMVKNPPGRFHVSFTESSSKGSSAQHVVSTEGDVTPATVDYTERETENGQTTSNTKHVERAHMSEMDLDMHFMLPVPWHGELIAANDATTPAGTETVNGYDTVKYVIDTAKEPPSQKAVFSKMMLDKDYKITGSAWVAKDGGALVKYAVDMEENGNDGAVKQTHFEGNVVKR
jgi:hypothetical protein